MLWPCNTSPKLVEILVAEVIYRPNKGVHQTPGNRFKEKFFIIFNLCGSLIFAPPDADLK
jgi:hypothetical protein